MGVEAVFIGGFKSVTLQLFRPFQGTAPELIDQIKNFGVAAKQSGRKWTFARTTKRSRLTSTIFIPGLRVPTQPRNNTPFDLNINPHPGQNLRPDAKPFDFNGERVYQVPIQPKCNE